MKNKISSAKLIDLIEDYRKAYVSSIYPIEFALYQYNAKVKTDRNPKTRLWEIYLEDQWRLFENTLNISLATEKINNSQVSGASLIPTLELLLKKVKESLTYSPTFDFKEMSLLPSSVQPNQ